MDPEHHEQMQRLQQYRRSVAGQSKPAISSSGLAGGSREASSQGLQIRYTPGRSSVEGEPVHDPLIYPGLYAPSGFDMMGILVRVGTRPNPIISLGNVDSSAPLVLCDAAMPDCPIVYCSEPFETLTGYLSSEILGRNCRFLQSPYAGRETTVGSDVNREARAVLREKIARGEEAQVRLVNYKKSGERFVNLVTIVPISWGEGEQSTGYKRYIVGFQADPNMALS